MRPVTQLPQSRVTLEGAGVHLHRAIGFRNAEGDTDPLLLLDGNENVIPDEAIIKLNVRTFDAGVRRHVLAAINAS